MLQTCTRCRSRRIKCDSLLPACANCARGDVECTFRDDALEEDIPRSYVKALNDRIQELSSQLALLPQHPTNNLPEVGKAEILNLASSSPLYVLMPGPRQDAYLNLSFASRMTMITFEVISHPQALPDTPQTVENGLIAMDMSQIDRSIVTPSVVRFLLAQYSRCIKPEFDILPPELLSHDGLSLKKLHGVQKFQILMACAISAARESYTTPSWRIVAQVCRAWASELVTPIISAGDEDSLTATLLLLIYEMADPRGGTVWELLDIAARICMQLGWHRPPQTTIQGLTPRDCSSASEESICNYGDTRLLSVLNNVRGSLQTVFNRPSLLGGFEFPTASEVGSILNSYTQLFRLIYDDGQLYEKNGCPFVGDVAIWLERIDTFRSEHPLMKETWLLFMPICVKHKQCIHCFQEDDDLNGKGMRWLRRRIVDAASQLISCVYRATTTGDGFIPPILATTRGFVAGCSLVTSIAKKWTSPESHTKDLIRCTEILSLFASHWEGGHGYLHVWRAIMASSP